MTVIGVTVVEARGTNTGVPAADTCTADHASPRTTDARLGLIVENYWEERTNLMQCNAIVISKTRVRSEAFQGQPFRVSLVGKGRLGGNAMMMRPSKETSVLAKTIKGRKEPDQTTIWEHKVLKHHLILASSSCCKSVSKHYASEPLNRHL